MIATEIIDHILGFLHSDHDYTTLEKCAVIFPEIAGRRLYSRLLFYNPSSPEISSSRSPSIISEPLSNYYIISPPKFHRTLLLHPHIATFVRVIRIIFLTFEVRDYYSATPVIACILPNLSQLQSITLEACSYHLWSSLHPIIRVAFQNAIRFQSVERVQIVQINDFSLNFFDECENLKSLNLYGRFIDGDCISTSRYPRLSTLHIESPYQLTRINQWAKANTLHTLSLLLPGPNHLDSIRTLIEACSQTLVNLLLHNIRYVTHHDAGYQKQYSDSPLLHFPLLTQLSIHVVWKISSLSGESLSCLPYLIPFLTSTLMLSPASSIRLCIQVEFFVFTAQIVEIDLSIFVPLFNLPVFCHPITMYVKKSSVQIVDDGFFTVDIPAQSSIQRLIEDRKLEISNGELPSSLC